MKTFISYLVAITIAGVGVTVYIDKSINSMIEAQRDTIPSSLSVVTNSGLLPSTESAEDDFTPTLALQETGQPQVTAHERFIVNTDSPQRTSTQSLQ